MWNGSGSAVVCAGMDWSDSDVGCGGVDCLVVEAVCHPCQGAGGPGWTVHGPGAGEPVGKDHLLAQLAAVYGCDD